MRFTFIAAKKAEHPVTILGRCLCVPRSGFYAWQARPESLHARNDRRFKVLVHTSFAESRRNYGSPRVHDDLIDWQEHVSRAVGPLNAPYAMTRPPKRWPLCLPARSVGCRSPACLIDSRSSAACRVVLRTACYQ